MDLIWLSKLWSVHIIEYCVAIKRSNVDLCLLTGKDFQDVYQEVAKKHVAEHSV